MKNSLLNSVVKHSIKKNETGNTITKLQMANMAQIVNLAMPDASAPSPVLGNMSQFAADCCLFLLEGKHFSQVLFLVPASQETHDRDMRDWSPSFSLSPRPPGVLSTSSRSPAWWSAVMHVVHTDWKLPEYWDRRNFISKAPVWERRCSVHALHRSLHVCLCHKHIPGW